MSARTTARSFLVGTAVLLSLAACGSDAGDDRSSPTPTPTASVEAQGLTGELTVFAAASLSGAFDELLAAFGAANPGVTIDPATYDGSSALVTQLSGGASADVFASADERTMQALTDAGLTEPTPRVFATNTLEIVVAPGNPHNIRSIADVGAFSDAGGTLVICAAEVPCGSAAHKVFDTAGVGVTIASNEQNVTSVLTKVQSGEADVGLVYRTDVLAAGDTVTGVEFPEAAAAVNSYAIAVLTSPQPRTHAEEVAQAFLDYVLSDDGQAVLSALGFTAP